MVALGACEPAVPVGEGETEGENSASAGSDAQTSTSSTQPSTDSSVPPNPSTTTTPVPPSPPPTATSPVTGPDDTGDWGESSSGFFGSSSATGEIGPYCGDGAVQPGEQCDGRNLQGLTCAKLGLDAGELGCDSQLCIFDTSGCVPAMPDCGDGLIEPGEQCDGMNVAGLDCDSLGLGEGELACSLECTFDTSGCSKGACGDGTVDPGEQCDGDDLQGFDCPALGLGEGELVCDPVMCVFDTSGCMP